MASRKLRATMALPVGVSLIVLFWVFSGYCADETAAAPAAAQEAGPILAPADAGVEGIASYYSKKYNGRKTSSGERYRPEKLTAAHPDLPLGTQVKVIHSETGREVVVKVNDRCRKKRQPFIDLSRAAARELGILGHGVARVRIVRLDESARAVDP